MKQLLHNVGAYLKTFCSGGNEPRYRVQWDKTAVRIEWTEAKGESGSLAFSWDSIAAVDTFKRDLFTVDCIWRVFETQDGWIEVNEEMNGWAEFLVAVRSSLPGFPSQEEWLCRVTIPAFAANHTRLWTRQKAHDGCRRGSD